jgi:hypothetical protein
LMTAILKALPDSARSDLISVLACERVPVLVRDEGFCDNDCPGSSCA